MARPRQFALVLLCATVTLAGWSAARLGGFEWCDVEHTAASIWNRAAAPGATTPLPPAMAAATTLHLKLPAPAVAHAAAPAADAAAVDPDPRETGFGLAGSAAAEAPAVEDHSPEEGSTPPSETHERLVSLLRSDAAAVEDLRPAARPVEIVDECLVVETCIDEYLWALYERTPKVDVNKVTKQIKTTVKTKKGKTRTVTKTITDNVVADFAWKDPIGAQKAGMSLKDYVIGGMDRDFKLKLFRAMRAMDEAGFMPGITSAFRDDYRQSIASGNKAASDSSFHGGSRRGGYGHGLAVDLVSVKGKTRLQQFAVSEELWKWIDAHEKELGVGRPYRDRDPPMSGRSMARNISPSVACRLCERQDCKQTRDKRGNRKQASGVAARRAAGVLPLRARGLTTAVAPRPSSIPIVTIVNPDPIGLGLAQSLARPGGNDTGLTDMDFGIYGKRIEILKQAAEPRVGRGVKFARQAALPA